MRKRVIKLLDKLIQRLVPELKVSSKSLNYLLQKKAVEATADFIVENMGSAQPIYELPAFWNYVFSLIPEEGLILEFGVYEGYSINHFAKLTARNINGFDSFEGLPADGILPQTTAGQTKWYVGKMDLQGNMPSVPSHVSLHAGWFDETLPKFLEGHPEDVALVHIDVDIYSSAQTVLNGLASRMRTGTVIIFDEYFNYEGWQKNEHKAFMEFVEKYKVDYDFVAYTYGQAAAVRINSIES